MTHREIQLELKAVSETGRFEGIAAVYGTVDQGGDIIQAGALTKTIRENKGRVPLLADHTTPIGVVVLADSSAGLLVSGQINLEKQVGRDTYSDLKFYRDHNVPYGMSIGYRTIKSEPSGGIRVLKEIQLVECSVTLFPMHRDAHVAAVKRADGAELFDQFKKEFSLLVKQARVESEFTQLVKSVQAMRR